MNMKQKYEQYIGQKFNHLTILEYIYNPEDKRYQYKHLFKCKCDCGNECIKKVYSIIDNSIKTCAKLNCKFNKTNRLITKYKECVGQKFNHLTILEYFYDENEKYGQFRYKFKCICDCGNECIRSSYEVINNKSKTCNYLDCKFQQSGQVIEKYKSMIGQKFGHLTILEHFYNENGKMNQKHQFKCKCDCGNECIRIAYLITKGDIKLCGRDCKFGSTIQSIEKYKSMIGQKFNKLTIIDFIYCEEEIDPYYKFQFKCECDCGNKEYYISISQLLFRTPNGCNECYTPSKIESSFKSWVEEINLNFIKTRIESDSNIQNQVEIDFLIDNKLGIELHGLVVHATTHYDHNNPFIGKKSKKYHLNKLNSAVNNDIELLQFWNTEWIQKEDICKSIILSKLGIFKYREYARNCIVKEIDKDIYNDFMNEHHIQGTTSNENIRLGLFYKRNNNLISVMSFGFSRYNNDVEWELFRFATYKNTQVVGSASKLFKYFIRNYNPISIVSYSDRRIFNNGKLYESLGFIFNHNSDPGYWYFKNNGADTHIKLYHRSYFMKHKLKDKLKTFDSNLTEWENMEKNGYLRIYDCGNKVYIWKKLVN